MTMPRCLGVTLPLIAPLVLASIAAIQYPEGPAGAFFGRFFAYFIQVVGCAYLFDTLFGAFPKKRILERYRQEGIDILGVLTKHHITIHRTNCIETHQSHTVDYVYEIVDEENGERAIYKKSKHRIYQYTLCRSSPWKAITTHGSSRRPVIPLKRIPLLDGSGYPTHLVEEELHCYWFGVLQSTVFGMAAATIGPAVLATSTEDSIVGVVMGSLWNMGVGIWMGWTTRQKWQEDTLLNGKVPSSNNNATFNYEHSMPEAVAVPVTGDNGMRNEENDNDEDGAEMTKVIV